MCKRRISTPKRCRDVVVLWTNTFRLHGLQKQVKLWDLECRVEGLRNRDLEGTHLCFKNFPSHTLGSHMAGPVLLTVPFLGRRRCGEEGKETASCTTSQGPGTSEQIPGCNTAPRSSPEGPSISWNLKVYISCDPFNFPHFRRESALFVYWCLILAGGRPPCKSR